MMLVGLVKLFRRPGFRSASRMACVWAAILSVPSMLGGCQTTSDALDAMTVSPPAEPLQLTYHPFAPIKYRQRTIDSQGRLLALTDFSVAAETAGSRIVLTVRIIGFDWKGRYESTGDLYEKYMTRLLIENNGRIVDAVSKSNVGIQSSDNSNVAQQYGTLMDYVIPLYLGVPVSPGHVIAESRSWTGDTGVSHFTMALAGDVVFHQTNALRLNFDQLVYEKVFRAGVAPAYPARGYIIVNPANGSVLKARHVDGDGETSVEML